MPGLTPGRRWQPAYYPFHNDTFFNHVMQFVERGVKGPLFGCRMCGNCLLQETAFICPMECPKGLRNGPCGGSTAEHCYVDPSRPCIWYKIYDRAEKMGQPEGDRAFLSRLCRCGHHRGQSHARVHSRAALCRPGGPRRIPTGLDHGRVRFHV